MTRMFAVFPMCRLDRFAAVVFNGLRMTVGRVLWVDRIAFYESDVKCESGGLAAPAFDIDFVEPTSEELSTKYRDPLEANFNLGPAKVRERLFRSHSVVLAVRGDAPVAMVWLAFAEQRVSEIGRILVLQPQEVLTYDELTLPAWRGRGISPALNRFADQVAAQRKVARRITWRRVSNAPAIRVAQKLGHNLLVVATTVRIAGRWHPFVRGLDSAGQSLKFRRR